MAPSRLACRRKNAPATGKTPLPLCSILARTSRYVTSQQPNQNTTMKPVDAQDRSRPGVQGIAQEGMDLHANPVDSEYQKFVRHLQDLHEREEVLRNDFNLRREDLERQRQLEIFNATAQKNEGKQVALQSRPLQADCFLQIPKQSRRLILFKSSAYRRNTIRDEAFLPRRSANDTQSLRMTVPRL